MDQPIRELGHFARGLIHHEHRVLLEERRLEERRVRVERVDSTLPVALELVEGGEVGVGDIGERTELSLEAIEIGRAQAPRRLERDASAADAIEGLEDDGRRRPGRGRRIS